MQGGTDFYTANRRHSTDIMSTPAVMNVLLGSLYKAKAAVAPLRTSQNTSRDRQQNPMPTKVL